MFWNDIQVTAVIASYWERLAAFESQQFPSKSVCDVIEPSLMASQTNSNVHEKIRIYFFVVNKFLY